MQDLDHLLRRKLVLRHPSLRRQPSCLQWTCFWGDRSRQIVVECCRPHVSGRAMDHLPGQSADHAQAKCKTRLHNKTMVQKTQMASSVLSIFLVLDHKWKAAKATNAPPPKYSALSSDEPKVPRNPLSTWLSESVPVPIQKSKNAQDPMIPART